ncbi:MAG TPA: phage shock protein operon transcriptional activator, partial [Xanthomonadales bacterium]|nr:phage shock protein operon transcriptional activator [Xanthomonadales bacterium]
MNRIEDQQLIGEAPAFQEVLERVSRVAQLNRPVLVIGERGTGKELIAARIHYLSPRWDKPYVKLNCAALTDSLLESELFGHEAGSFTGALKRRLGRFEMANQGSIFLDELANTSERVQEKILRVIEYGELERVGGSETIRSDVRIVGATNEDLPGLTESGKFRADLLDRLAFDVITLPPLRERREDIIPMAEHFAVKMCGELGLSVFAGFSSNAREQLVEYSWPGNIRELKNVCERAVYTSSSESKAIESIVFDPFDSPWRPQAPVTAPAEGKAAGMPVEAYD